MEVDAANCVMHSARKGLVLITGVHISGLVPVVRTILYIWGLTPCKRRSVVRPLGEWVLSAGCASRWARARTMMVYKMIRYSAVAPDCDGEWGRMNSGGLRRESYGGNP